MEKLRIKDLVTIGVFTVIYFVLMFASGMIGIVPILYLAYPTLAGIITGIVIMLFMAKVQKSWGLFILGLICSLVAIAMGNTYVILIHAVISMAIAELLRKKENINHLNLICSHLPYSTLGFVVSLCKFCWLKTRLLNWLKQAVWVTII